MNVSKAPPNFAVKKATIKNLRPLEIRQIIKNIKMLKFIMPPVMVKTLNGRGVNPAKNKVPNQTYKPLP